MKSSVEGPAFRYGAPAAVVDPLLSFLFDLRRMEATVLSALEHIGVQRHRLPAPFGAGADARSGHETPRQQGREGEEEEVSAAPATSSSTAIVTSSSSVDSTTSSAFDAYVADRFACGLPLPPRESVAAVEQVLSWLDERPSASPPCVLSPSSASATAARSFLVAVVAAGESREAVLVDADTKAEASLQRKAAKRPRVDVTSAPTAALDAADRCHVATLSLEDVHASAQLCHRYERLLKSGAAELSASLRAVTTSDLAASYSCHAKWVEVSSADARVRCVVPASAALKTNCERLIAFNDAFATCQAAVHGAYVALEEAVDTLLEEAVVVDEAECGFQRCVEVAQGECGALQDLRRRLKRTRRALDRAAAMDA